MSRSLLAKHIVGALLALSLPNRWPCLERGLLAAGVYVSGCESSKCINVVQWRLTSGVAVSFASFLRLVSREHYIPN